MQKKAPIIMMFVYFKPIVTTSLMNANIASNTFQVCPRLVDEDLSCD
jgi:hypothetical protein